MERIAVNHVYALLHPMTRAVRYIGVTRKTPEQRLVQHLCKARRLAKGSASTPLHCWLNKPAKIGLSPQVVLLETGTEREEAERRWIYDYKSEDAQLLNQTDGGDGFRGLHRSPEHCQKISEALRGRKRPPEIAQMLSRVHRGKVLSDETKRKMSATRTGKIQSEATKAKRCSTLLGCTYSAERRANISAGKKRAIAARQFRQSSDDNRPAL